MRRERWRSWLWRSWLVATVAASVWVAPGAAQPPAPAAPGCRNAATLKVWLGREAEFEAYLRDADIVRIEAVPIGVSKPKRAYFSPGGLVESAAWKPLPPAVHQGYWDSYKAEIAAYELDKLLELEMVPPTVEKRVNGELGALVMWLSPTRVWGDVEKEAQPERPEWRDQVIRMKMFDNLICNRDRNLGNLLVDASWNLYLIDHSRAFITSKDLPVRMSQICRELWAEMTALDEPVLERALGHWLNGKEIKAILDRRDRMAKTIGNLVAAHGEATVLVQ
jgi:hypothetical protein